MSSVKLNLYIVKESALGEARVALVPEVVTRLKAKFSTLNIFVEKGAGEAAGFEDDAYQKAGAQVVAASKFKEADVIACVRPIPEKRADTLKKNALLLGMLEPFGHDALFKSVARQKASALALEKIPRISRAQSMDVLSSQANLAGYRAVLEAASRLPKFFPLMMTAAGSSKPAKVMILGVGVAGLQAIATARRLGAQVEAFDVRPETKEQVHSLGAKFIELDVGEEASGEGGYAKELSEKAKKKQQEMLQEVLKKADVVITTAQIPGKKAPVLLTEQAVKGMKQGSVVVDMAAGSGGNCPLSEPDKVLIKHGVTLVGYTNYPSFVAQDASLFYARNMMNVLQLVLEEKEGRLDLNLDEEDDIITSALIVKEGEVRI